LKQVLTLAPVDIAATATRGVWVDIDQCVGFLEFEVQIGAITSTDAASAVVVTVEGSTSNATSDTGTAIAFQYQLSEAVGTDTLGAVTAATSTGLDIDSSSDDSKLLLIYVDPGVVRALGDDYRYVTPVLDGAATVSAALASISAHFTPRYSQASQKSST
jgi:hypothetical protein